MKGSDSLIPGEVSIEAGTVPLRADRARAEVWVTNGGDRPIQVGSHMHFFEVNAALVFERASAYGMCLDIAAGTALRFEPGIERPVALVAVGGERRIVGLRGLTQGALDDPATHEAALRD